MGIINALCNSPLPNQFTTSMSVRERKMSESALILSLLLLGYNLGSKEYLLDYTMYSVQQIQYSYDCSWVSLLLSDMSIRNLKNLPTFQQYQKFHPQILPLMSGFQIPTYL